MNNAVRNTGVALILNALFSMTCWGQLDLSKYEIGVNAGSFIYQGDLTPSAVGSFKTPSLVFGLYGSRKLSNALAIRLDFSRGRLKGDDAKYNTPEWRQERNFKFTTPVTEVAVLLVYTPIGRERLFNPYLFAGIGNAFVKINRDYSAFNAEFFANERLGEALEEDLNHNTPNRIPVVPVGAGLRYKWSSNLSFYTEGSYRYMSTDYLDGFSQAANPELKDHFYKFSVGAIFSFNRKNDPLACPVF